MNLSIPILVQETKQPGQATPLFVVRPLFTGKPKGSGEQLSGAIAKLARELRKDLNEAARQPRQEKLLKWTFSPSISEHRLKQKLTLRRNTADCIALVVSFKTMDRHIAMMPALPTRWFEILRGQKVVDRAAEVLTSHLKDLESERDDFSLPAKLTGKDRQWVTSLELDVQAAPKFPKPSDALLALLGGSAEMDGEIELNKVGRCLDWLYPDNLRRSLLRDAEVKELDDLLSRKERRPVLLLGPSMVGKTAIVQECVYQRVSRANSPHVSHRNTWLLSPQRLISGMIYLGQWESRVVAIIKAAAKRDHLLYFDDVLGLFYAGLTRDSNLSVAHVLKPYIERREFRVLAEMTPEAFRILQERDRGLADLFHIIPVRPTSESQTRRILVGLMRDLEGQHKCEFGLEVLPQVLDLSNRYLRGAAQPGKSAQSVRQLAAKFAAKSINRSEVLGEFHDSSGLSLDFLDSQRRLRHSEVVEALGRKITGQEEAITAMADVVCIARARLNDPGRPLASLLFLGPTGVGKTQCVKALAEYLFGDESRLLRFDMNEYIEGSAAGRLNGTIADPEGQLTAAVRRQPFCVILLDEIEKAHPAVFDLLLQVLGEGRLTDAMGRTSDFGNAIVIMTSNLGVREANVSFGLRPGIRATRQVFVDAAERFFRPEFCNRIDRLVPFESLSRQQIGQIAHRLIDDVFRRDGLVHRRCILSIDPAAMERVIDEGYHPQLGARALKRCIERQLMIPVADHLAAVAPDAPTVIRLGPATPGISVRVDALVSAERRPLSPPELDLADWESVLDRVEAAVDRAEQLVASGHADGKLTQGQISSQHFRYLAVNELAGYIRRSIDRLDHQLGAPKGKPVLKQMARGGRAPSKTANLFKSPAAAILRAFASLQTHLAELEAEPVVFGESAADQLVILIHLVSHLIAIATAAENEDRCLVSLSSPNLRAEEQMKELASAYRSLFLPTDGFSASLVDLHHIPKQTNEKGDAHLLKTCASPFSFSATDPRHGVLLEMPGIARVMMSEQGTHLFEASAREMIVVQVIVQPTDNEGGGMNPASRETLPRVAGFIPPQLSQQNDHSEVDPLGPVIRSYQANGMTTDLRSGLAVRGFPAADDLRKFIRAQLPWPSELTE